mgnify:CR=1 FL=1
MRLIDMHMHSIFSDGRATPERLASLGKKRGLSLMALTDHDTTAGIPSFLRACAREGISGLTGIELSAEAPFTLHILGYRFNTKNSRLLSKLEEIRRARGARNIKICEKLRALGCQVNIEEAEALSNGEVVARPHIARVLISKGYVPDMGAAFSRYLDRKAPAYVPRERLSPAECISLIKEAGGLAVLAHPAQCRLEEKELEALAAELKAMGLWGIEAVYGSNSPETTYAHRKLAAKLGLFTTAGSDYHGDRAHSPEPGMLVGDDLLPWLRLTEK